MSAIDPDRVRANAELAEIRGLFHGRLDAPSQKIIDWYTRFAAALRTNAPVQPIIDEYRYESIDLLDGLVDEMQDMPKDDSHPIRHLLSLLLNPHAILHTDDIQRAFGHLARQSDDERTFEKKRDHEVEEAQSVQELKGLFSAFTLEMKEVIDAERKEENEFFQVQLESAQKLSQQDQEAFEVIMAEIRTLERDIEALTERNQELREGLSSVHTRIHETEASNAKLRVAINEAKIAMKKKQRSWLQDLGTAILVIGAACVASWALSKILPELAVSIAPGGLRTPHLPRIPGMPDASQQGWTGLLRYSKPL